MNEVRIKPRKKPVILGSAILLVMIAVCGVLTYAGSESDMAGIMGGLLAAMIILLICIVGGYIRSVIILREDGIYSVTALFARPVLYKWKAVDRVLHEGKNYAIYSTQNKWIGTIDEREPQLQEALKVLKQHKVRMSEIRPD